MVEFVEADKGGQVIFRVDNTIISIFLTVSVPCSNSTALIVLQFRENLTFFPLGLCSLYGYLQPCCFKVRLL